MTPRISPQIEKFLQHIQDDYTELLDLALALETTLEFIEDREQLPYQKLHALLKPIHYQMQLHLSNISLVFYG